MNSMERMEVKMGREENIQIFEDTEKLCKTNEKLKASVKNATAGQKLIRETDIIPKQNRNLYEEPAKVTVSKKRSFEAAKGYKGLKTVVHNFASATTPGGGVVNGARAQEECLCRCSGLYFSINTPEMWEGFYKPHRDAHDPIHNDDLIFTPGVTVFKTDTSNPVLMPEKDWYNVDVITCAAPKLQGNGGNNPHRAVMKDKDLLALHEKRLRRILEAALSEGAEAIVLGAFGCGAFCNSPEVVARANKNVLEEYLHAFKHIEYAVYSNQKDETNYRTFERVLRPLCK